MNIFNIIAAVSTENLKKSLEIFWKGALAIAIVLTIVFVITKIMTIVLSQNVNKKPPEKKALEKEQPELPKEEQ